MALCWFLYLIVLHSAVSGSASVWKDVFSYLNYFFSGIGVIVMIISD